LQTKEIVEVSLSQLDLWSFISSIFSLSIAIIAIVLSIFFGSITTNEEEYTCNFRKNGGSINFAKLHDKYSDNFKLLWNALEKLVEEEKIENPFNYVIEEEDKVIFNGTKIQIKN